MIEKERNEIQSRLNKTETQVLSKVSLYNNLGRINAKHMFQLFGPMPRKGSYFLFGSSEWLSKNLIEITIQICWEKDIPKDFARYYLAYPGQFSNSCFKIAFNILEDGVWNLWNGKSFSLFEENNDNTVSHISTFNLNLEDILVFTKSREYSDSMEYNDKTKDGFIKMQLVEPIHGFGNEVYNEAIIEQAKLSKENSFWEHLKFWKKREVALKIPSLPYVPVVDKIEIHMTYLNPL